MAAHRPRLARVPVRQETAPGMRLAAHPRLIGKKGDVRADGLSAPSFDGRTKNRAKGTVAGAISSSVFFFFSVFVGRIDSGSSSVGARAPPRNPRTRRKNEADPRVGRWLIYYFFFFVNLNLFPAFCI